jgi:acyl carrier protein
MTESGRAAIEAQVKGILAKELSVALETITPEKRLIEDLGMDSFASVELMFELEDKLKITIPDDNARDLKTVDDVINYIASRVQQ